MSPVQGQIFQARIEGNPVSHSLFWPTQPNFRYSFQMSEDLKEWHDTGSYVVGDGLEKDIHFNRTNQRLFYRVLETGFLVLPGPSQRVDLIDGVCFGFNLTQMAQLPAKIRIYKRSWNSGDRGTRLA